jgi:hypothetical protein
VPDTGLPGFEQFGSGLNIAAPANAQVRSVSVPRPSHRPASGRIRAVEYRVHRLLETSHAT